MKTPLWIPSEDKIKNANLTRFLEYVNKKDGRHLRTYPELYEWSIEAMPEFWARLWEFADIKASRGYDQVVDDVRKMPGAKWFSGARLNFAENLLRYRDDRPAFIFRGETQKKAQMTYAELYAAVARLARSLRGFGAQTGGPGGGLYAEHDGDGHRHAGGDLRGGRLVLLRHRHRLAGGPRPPGADRTQSPLYREWVLLQGKDLSAPLAMRRRWPRGFRRSRKSSWPPISTSRRILRPFPTASGGRISSPKRRNPSLEFEQLPFDHPVYIMFSSGTTGKPKCMVQGAGGILINHLKELVLHTDLKREDRILYITTCSWMMWNWLISSLGVGATVVLYDGNPSYPDDGAMWKLLQDEKVTIFGTSASYLNYLKSQGFQSARTIRPLRPAGDLPDGLSPLRRRV